MSVQPRPFVDGDARRARDLEDLDDGAVASRPRVRVVAVDGWAQAAALGRGGNAVNFARQFWPSFLVAFLYTARLSAIDTEKPPGQSPSRSFDVKQ